jgi:hypothetical protein
MLAPAGMYASTGGAAPGGSMKFTSVLDRIGYYYGGLYWLSDNVYERRSLHKTRAQNARKINNQAQAKEKKEIRRSTSEIDCTKIDFDRLQIESHRSQVDVSVDLAWRT